MWISCACCCIDNDETTETSRCSKVYHNDIDNGHRQGLFHGRGLTCYNYSHRGETIIIPSSEMINNDVKDKMCWKCAKKIYNLRVNASKTREKPTPMPMVVESNDENDAFKFSYHMYPPERIARVVQEAQDGCKQCYEKCGKHVKWKLCDGGENQTGLNTSMKWKCEKGQHMMELSSSDKIGRVYEVNAEAYSNQVTSGIYPAQMKKFSNEMNIPGLSDGQYDDYKTPYFKMVLEDKKKAEEGFMKRMNNYCEASGKGVMMGYDTQWSRSQSNVIGYAPFCDTNFEFVLDKDTRYIVHQDHAQQSELYETPRRETNTLKGGREKRIRRKANQGGPTKEAVGVDGEQVKDLEKFSRNRALKHLAKAVKQWDVCFSDGCKSNDKSKEDLVRSHHPNVFNGHDGWHVTHPGVQKFNSRKCKCRGFQGSVICGWCQKRWKKRKQYCTAAGGGCGPKRGERNKAKYMFDEHDYSQPKYPSLKNLQGRIVFVFWNHCVDVAEDLKERMEMWEDFPRWVEDNYNVELIHSEVLFLERIVNSLKKEMEFAGGEDAHTSSLESFHAMQNVIRPKGKKDGFLSYKAKGYISACAHNELKFLKSRTVHNFFEQGVDKDLKKALKVGSKRKFRDYFSKKFVDSKRPKKKRKYENTCFPEHIGIFAHLDEIIDDMKFKNQNLNDEEEE